MPNATISVHVGAIHASGWIITKKMQVTIMHIVNTMRNNLILANKGLVVFIFIGAIIFGFSQYSDLAQIMLLSLVFIKIMPKEKRR